MLACGYSQPCTAMPARSRIDDLAPSAATRRRASMIEPSASSISMQSRDACREFSPPPFGRGEGEDGMDRIRARPRPVLPSSTPTSRALPSTRAKQRPVLHHVREWLALLHLAGECQERRPHRIVEARVGDAHVEDRLRAVRNRAATRRWSRTAGAPRRQWLRRADRSAAFERGIRNRHLERWPERLLERNRERQPGKARAADQDVDPFIRR